MFDEALKFATEKHIKQVRKYTGEPYINHCLDVVSILKRHAFNDELMHTWAILHDTIEDTDATYQDIFKLFGLEVMQGVFWLTDAVQQKDGNRAARSVLNSMHTASCPSPRNVIVKLADIVSNTSSITKHDPDFSRVYLREKNVTLDYIIQLHPTLEWEPIYMEARQYLKKDGHNG